MLPIFSGLKKILSYFFFCHNPYPPNRDLKHAKIDKYLLKKIIYLFNYKNITYVGKNINNFTRNKLF